MASFLWYIFYSKIMDIHHCKLKGVQHGSSICIYCEMITRIGLVNICHHRCSKREKILVMRILRIYSVISFPIYHTSVLTVVIILYITFLVLINWKLVPFNHLSQFPFPLYVPLLTQTMWEQISIKSFYLHWLIKGKQQLFNWEQLKHFVKILK